MSHDGALSFKYMYNLSVIVECARGKLNPYSDPHGVSILCLACEMFVAYTHTATTKSMGCFVAHKLVVA